MRARSESSDDITSALAGQAYASEALFLELNGLNCGPVRSVEEAAGMTGFSLKIDLSLKHPAYDWLAAAWTSYPSRQTGAVISADGPLMAKTRRTFNDAQISETIIPALDAESKAEAFLTFKITAALGSPENAAGRVFDGSDNSRKGLASNFRLQIDGLDCTNVITLDSFTVTNHKRAG